MRHILIRTTDTNIIYETIVTAGQEKIESLVDDIAEYIYYDSRKLMAGAVEALVQIGTDSAVHRLEQASTTTKCDKTILCALESLSARKKSAGKQVPIESKTIQTREERNFLSLHAKLESVGLDTRFKAFNDMADLMKDDLTQKQIFILAEDIKSGSHDLKINTLRLIGKTIQGRLLPDIYGLLDHNSVDPKIKFAAFEALSAFPELDSAAAAVNGIEDLAMYVRMAAAKVLNRNATDFVCAEIKDRIESGGERGAMIVRTLIDAKAENIMEYLMVSDTFSYIASNYLLDQAPLSSLNKYTQILRKRGLKSTAKKFEKILVDKTGNAGLPVMVISPSSSVQDVYEKLLAGEGYASMGYSSCQNAFEELSNIKPALILCDLFLNTMTGIDFIREVRDFYPKDELPVILLSRQKQFTSAFLEKECKTAGINSVVEFPAAIPGRNSIVIH